MKKLLLFLLVIALGCSTQDPDPEPEPLAGKDVNARISPLIDCNHVYQWCNNRTTNSITPHLYWHYTYNFWQGNPDVYTTKPGLLQYNMYNGGSVAIEFRTAPNKPGTIVQPGQTWVWWVTIPSCWSGYGGVSFHKDLHVYRVGGCPGGQLGFSGTLVGATGGHSIVFGCSPIDLSDAQCI